MMEFIDRFRAAANRAKLVQSRIKAVEKMDREYLIIAHCCLLHDLCLIRAIYTLF